MRHIKRMYHLNRGMMPRELMADMVLILDNLDGQHIDRDAAVVQLMVLDVDENQHRIRDAFVNLVRKLPEAELDEGLREMERNTRFIEPFLSGLFDRPSEGVFFRWLDKRTMESQRDESINQMRPDITVMRAYGVHWALSSAFVEARPSFEASDNYLLCKDLVRGAILCKETLDQHNMDGVLGIQVVGNDVTFYVMTLPAPGIYSFCELAVVTIPPSIRHLPKRPNQSQRQDLNQ